MSVLRGQATIAGAEPQGARARTMRLMVQTAVELMQDGRTPSVSDVAEAAGVSRATSYRYFPSQAALVSAVVDAALGPVLEWEPRSATAAARVDDLLGHALPRIGEFEATFRAALRLSLEQWRQSNAGAADGEAPYRRGNRVDLLRTAIAPLRGTVSDEQLDKLAKGLSLVFGIESFVVLKDIWGLDQHGAEDTITWVARALVASVTTGDQPADDRGADTTTSDG